MDWKVVKILVKMSFALGKPPTRSYSKLHLYRLHRGLRLVWIISMPGRLSGVREADGARIPMEDL